MRRARRGRLRGVAGHHPHGKYLECDSTPDAILACPFDARLKAQVLTYAANKQRLCPQGCGGALLLLRQQCGGFTGETVNTPQNQSIGIVTLAGNSCLGNVSQVMYVQVVIENGQPLADDVMCNMGRAEVRHVQHGR